MSLPSGLVLACPICLNRTFTELLPDPLFVRCSRCTHGFQAYPPTNPLGIYLRSEYDKRRQDTPTSAVDKPVFARFNHDFAVGLLRLEQIATYLPRGNKITNCCWTDFGCGSGGMLEAVRRYGYQPRGVELDADFCFELATLLGIRTVTTYEFLNKPYSYPGCVLSMFDVLEHLCAPVGVLKQAAASLAVDGEGIIVIEVPDFSQHSGPLTEWKHHKPDEHLHLFTPASLNALLKLHFKEFVSLHSAIPIPGKLQVVWRKSKHLP